MTISPIKPNAKRTFAVSVTSGKGGVGKTLTTVNLAAQARRMGLKTLIFDGDLGLANVDVVMGVHARYNIHDVLAGHVPLEDVIVTGPLGIDLIPSGSGVLELSNLSRAQKQLISEQLARLDGRYDLMLIDTGAGIGDNVLHLNLAADKTLVVTTPEPHALTDAYALCKVMTENHGTKSFDLAINQVRSEAEGLKVFERFAEVALRFTKARISYAGSIPHDPQVSRSVMSRRAAAEQSTSTIAGQAWAQIARRLFDSLGAAAGRGDAVGNDFWRQYLSIDQGGLARARVGF